MLGDLLGFFERHQFLSKTAVDAILGNIWSQNRSSGVTLHKI